MRFRVHKTTSAGWHWYGHAQRISHSDFPECYREQGAWLAPNGRGYPSTALLGFDSNGSLVIQTPFTHHRYVQSRYTCGADTYTVTLTQLPKCRHFHFTTRGPAKAETQDVWYHHGQQGVQA